VKERISPLRYFRQLVDEPEVLMQKMLLEGIILSGPRAAEYFLPDPVTEGSDWDFFHPAELTPNYEDMCPEVSYLLTGTPPTLHTYSTGGRYVGEDLLQSFPFVEFLSNKGGKLIDFKCYDEKEGWLKLSDTCVATYLFSKPDGTSNRVNVIFTGLLSAVDAILSFSSTITQCFLSGFGAFHLNYSTSQNRRVVEWSKDRHECYVDPDVACGMLGSDLTALILREVHLAMSASPSSKAVSHNISVAVRRYLTEEVGVHHASTVERICYIISESRGYNPQPLAGICWKKLRSRGYTTKHACKDRKYVVNNARHLSDNNVFKVNFSDFYSSTVYRRICSHRYAFSMMYGWFETGPRCEAWSESFHSMAGGVMR